MTKHELMESIRTGEPNPQLPGQLVFNRSELDSILKALPSNELAEVREFFGKESWKSIGAFELTCAEYIVSACEELRGAKTQIDRLKQALLELLDAIGSEPQSITDYIASVQNAIDTLKAELKKNSEVKL
jgi:flagellar capping protein FliD